MLFVISPAKSLDYDTPPHVPTVTQPRFAERALPLLERLRELSPQAVGELMSISDKLAVLNVGRYAEWDVEHTPAVAKQAVLAFDGDVYDGLSAATLSAADLDWAQDRLRILSGLYGALRPLDLLRPYRLEMGTKLVNPAGKDLYAYWGDSVTASLREELANDPHPVLINLASEEYFKVVRRPQLGARIVDCVFEDWKGGKWKIISFHAKRARGLMVRYAIESRAKTPSALTGFAAEGYAYAEAESTPDRLVFRRREA